MKVSAQWLQEFLSKRFDVKELANALELAGIEVEQIVYSKPLDKKIVVGRVTKVVQHPNADKLKLTTVDTGNAKHSIVCGAPNVAQGLTVAVALPGATLPDGHAIEKAEIRGTVSEGMLCSPRELGWSDDHAGLAELDPKLPLGKTLCDIVYSADILDVTTPANRPDLQSMIGLAREVAAIGGGEVVQPETEAGREGGKPLEVELADPQLVPRYVVEKLSLGKSHNESPGWMQERLLASGVRPINLIVDVTNYVMLEYGQPLHAFDVAHVHSPLSVRLAKKGEKLVTLDGVERKLAEQDLVIADARGPIGLAGVMGGLSSQITPDTKDIILEAATFSPSHIRKTALRHGLRSEASARFERGLPVQLAPIGMSRAVKLLKELADAKQLSPTTDMLQVWPWVQRVGVRRSRLSSRLGVDVKTADIIAALARLGITAEPFDIVAEARKHLGKPYYIGARLKTHGTSAFDCSYLIDYIYSLIGVWPGYTALAQYDLGQPVQLKDLRPGDVVFYEGVKEKSVQGHYYRPLGGGKYEKVTAKHQGFVGHNGLYIGDNEVIDARKFVWEGGKWRELPKAQQAVQTVPLDYFTSNPGFLGARRFVDDLDDYISIPAVPWWRPDIKTEEDIIEEVARMIGYSALPATIPAWRPLSIKFDQKLAKVWQAKSVMKGLGLFEVMTYSFVSAQQIDSLGYAKDEHLKLNNPLSSEQAYLRRDLLASLLTAVARNQTYAKEFGLFEVSRVFKPKTDHSKLPDEPTHVGAIVRGGYQKAKAVFDALAREFNLDASVKAAKHETLEPGRSASIIAKGRTVGRLGLVSPAILRAYDLPEPVAYFEADWDALIAATEPKQYRELSRFPAAVRDLAVVVKESVTWADIEAAVRQTGLAEPDFLSQYFGDELPAGHKSIALRLSMSDPERTLTDKDVASRLSRIVKSLEEATGAKQR